MKRTILIFVLISATAQAKGLNKCVIDGKIAYTQKNCPTHESRAVISGGTFNSIDTADGFSDQGEEARANSLQVESDQAENQALQDRNFSVRRQLYREGALKKVSRLPQFKAKLPSRRRTITIRRLQ